MALRTALLAFACLAAVLFRVDACTNLIVTPGASADGSTIYSYSADSAALYGTLDRTPGRKNIPGGTMKKIWDWDSGLYLGQIEEVGETFDVIGNMNEHQLTIGETTFGGVEELCQGQKGAVMDYGSLIWTTLQRAKTVPEAISVMADLVARYGYASEGESFTLTDPREAWVMELIGKGQGEKGAVWMAVKIPDGHVAAHANQARIPHVDMTTADDSVARWAPDVVDFAVKKKLYDPSKGVPFSFSDVYDPITFSGARNGEARVWSFFSKVTSIPNFEATYEAYALGSQASPRMPLHVPVKKKLTVHDIMMHMRDHYEDTALNMTSDVGAGPWAAKFRDRPLTWKYGKENYVNERSIGTQQTAWHFVANMRQWLPDPVGGVFWFGVDDATFSVHIPFYARAAVPKALRTGTGGILDLDLDSLFWLNDMVANKVYSKWEILAPIVAARVWELEKEFLARQPEVEAQALALWKQSQLQGASDPGASASKHLSKHSAELTKNVQKKWLQLWKHLHVTFRDGVKVLGTTPGHDHGGKERGGPVADMEDGSGVGNGEWRDAWKKEIVDQAGDHFRGHGGDHVAETAKSHVMEGKGRNAATTVRVAGGRGAEGNRDSATILEIVS
mmetsp:Transcript_10679/g.25451  ORF Transcript_10679/g.25451 Transcript_10679/m.25451 type:complete len:619 (+) Transcript_10679:25-1881(+)